MQTTTSNLDGMTHQKWQSLPIWERETLRDLSGLTPQLTGLNGKRVEVVTEYGTKRRFWVGMSTGWKPIHLEVKTSRSLGGMAADKKYKSVTIIR